MRQAHNIHNIIPNLQRLVASGVLNAFLVSLLTHAGCSGLSYRSKDGTRHHLIVGVGLVSTHQQPGISVLDNRTIGFLAHDGGVGAGLVQHHAVQIDPYVASNAVVSIRATPFTLTVTNFSRADCLNNEPKQNHERNSE